MDKRKMIDETGTIDIPNKKPKMEKDPLQLSDLNDDCLVEIFKYCTIDDLINIVDYDTYFIDAARSVFRKKFAKNCIRVTTEFDIDYKTATWSEKILKFFGCEIMKLSVNYNKGFHRFDEAMDKAILLQCRKSLLEIELTNPERFTMYGIEEPFQNVKVVSLVDGSFSKFITDFDKFFPAAHTLKLKNLKSEDYRGKMKKNIKNYPVLKHFEIQRMGNQYEIEDPISKAIIKMNPQLKSLSNVIDIEQLEIDEDDENYRSWMEQEPAEIDTDEIYINENLPNLESFRLVISGDEYVIQNMGIKKHFKKLKELALVIEYPENLGALTNLISIDELEVLKLPGNYLDSNYMKLIRAYKHVKSIEMVCAWSQSYSNQLFEMFSTLPNLIHIQFSNCFNNKLSPNKIIDLLTRCKLLNQLTVVGELKNLKQVTAAFNATLIKSPWNFSIVKAETNRSSRLIFKN